MPSSPASDPVRPPTFADVESAADRLAGVAVRTPLIEAHSLGAAIGGRLFIKPEMLQRTGSFKFRGAYNTISRLPEETRTRGVVAYSSGNHGQAVALVAKILGCPATIVMPSDAPKLKIDATRGHGAHIVLYDRWTEDRQAVADGILAETGGSLVPPFEHPMVIAGQGTVGLEIVRDLQDLGVAADIVLVPCSGGGLIAGCGLAIKHAWPEAAIFSVEPDGFDDMARSLAAGRRVDNPSGKKTICDALQVPTPGRLTFEINRRLLTGGLAVSDDETRAAMAAAFRDLKLVVEPGGCVALAAVLAGKPDCRGKTVVVVCSGGNVDPETYCESLARTA